LLRNTYKSTRRSVSLVSVYYDTRKWKLRKHGLTLRVRRAGRRYTQTVKREGDLSSAFMDRFESERDIAGEKPNLDLAADTGLKPILSRKLQAKLRPLFETHVRRTLYSIRRGASNIELTVDKGKVVAGRQSSPICEVELELKHGDAADLFKVARALAEQAPVQLAVTSKSERGFALIGGKLSPVVGMASLAIAPAASSQSAFQTIARVCLQQIVANRESARAGASEGIHQARVGLRRLRAAISLFVGMLHDRQSAAIKQGLKWITLELGPARELDVFIKLVVNPATAGKPTEPGVRTVTRELRRKRRAAFAKVRSAIDSDRFRLLVLDTAAWIEFGAWTRNPDAVARAIRDQPIATTAAAQLQHYRKQIMKQSKRLADLDPDQRHKRRIEAKKLRYASEFFGATFPGKKATRRRTEFIASLGQLQDTLGELNDISVHERLTERLAGANESGSGGSRTTSDKAFVAGRLSGREEARSALVLEDAERAYARFARAKTFWR
jgi:inorganic triphosphatase YgiF